jgi:UDPglucose 6-dehydrogenase
MVNGERPTRNGAPPARNGERLTRNRERPGLTGERPRLTVFGTGYLGAAHAACMAELGFEVLGVDTDASRLEALRRGEPGIYEEGLAGLLARNLAAGRLSFTTSYRQAAQFGDVHFLCVGTPQQRGAARAELSQLYACIGRLAPLLARPCLVVGKSTVPVGTAEALAQALASCAPAGSDAELAWNPEFLREGHAVADTLRPDRIVAGVRSSHAEAVLRRVYAAPLARGVPLVVTDLATAELVKLAANAFLATKISFINAMAEVCEATGGDVVPLARALGQDSRIGPDALQPGLGFGGGCLSKDIRAFLDRGRELGVAPAVGFLSEVDAINQRRRDATVALAAGLAGGSLAGDSLAGRRAGVLGLAFKPESDDIRDSPALEVAARISDLGATVTAYDPAAMGRARRACPRLRYAGSMAEAAQGADVLLLLTEWAEFAGADPYALGGVVTHRNVVDGRNVLDPARWRAAGWRYRALGRPASPDPPPDGGSGPASSARPAAASTPAASARASTGSVRPACGSPRYPGAAGHST